jgi:hypothetical protein
MLVWIFVPLLSWAVPYYLGKGLYMIVTKQEYELVEVARPRYPQSPASPHHPSADLPEQGRRQCPYCGEWILNASYACGYCGRAVAQPGP